MSTEVFVATSWDASRPVNRLSGLLFLDDCLIVGTDGLESYLQKNLTLAVDSFREGRFCLLLNDPKGFTSYSDGMGQDVIFYYQSRNDWALSNSLIALAKRLENSGKRLTINRYALAGFQVGNYSLFGGQLLSNQTPISEIRILPIDKAIRVTWQEPEGSRFELVPLPKLQPISRNEYHDELVAYASLWANRLRAMSESKPAAIKIDLSGGYDSRVTFALTYFAIRDRDDRYYIHSDPKKSRDLAIAAAIHEHYGITTTRIQERRRKPPPVEAYELWKLGSAGVYLRIYPPNGTERSSLVHVTGGHFRATAYSAKDALARSAVFERRLARNKSLAHGLVREFKKSFDDIGIDIRDPSAMQEHYMHFRARFHYGRAWYKNCTALWVTPLLSARLKRISKAREYSPQGLKKVALDLLSLFDPVLAEFPFLEGDLRVKAKHEDVIGKRGPMQFPELSVSVYGRIGSTNEADTNNEEEISTEAQSFEHLLAKDVEHLGKDAVSKGLLEPGLYQAALAEIRRGARPQELQAAAHVATVGILANYAEP